MSRILGACQSNTQEKSFLFIILTSVVAFVFVFHGVVVSELGELNFSNYLWKIQSLPKYNLIFQSILVVSIMFTLVFPLIHVGISSFKKNNRNSHKLKSIIFKWNKTLIIISIIVLIGPFTKSANQRHQDRDSDESGHLNAVENVENTDVAPKNVEEEMLSNLKLEDAVVDEDRQFPSLSGRLINNSKTHDLLEYTLMVTVRDCDKDKSSCIIIQEGIPYDGGFNSSGGFIPKSYSGGKVPAGQARDFKFQGIEFSSVPVSRRGVLKYDVSINSVKFE